MSRYYFDRFGEETLPNDPACHWCVVWVRTANGWHAHVGERIATGWGEPHTLVFEGFEFTPHDALLAWEATRRQVPTTR